ncbi:MAG: hypothetical protein CL521_05245 [Actinobacteria bacterium]|nr:hypothetical protein [Actinomycetota bacterium]
MKNSEKVPSNPNPSFTPSPEIVSPVEQSKQKVDQIKSNFLVMRKDLMGSLGDLEQHFLVKYQQYQEVKKAVQIESEHLQRMYQIKGTVAQLQTLTQRQQDLERHIQEKSDQFQAQLQTQKAKMETYLRDKQSEVDQQINLQYRQCRDEIKMQRYEASLEIKQARDKWRTVEQKRQSQLDEKQSVIKNAYEQELQKLETTYQDKETELKSRMQELESSLSDQQQQMEDRYARVLKDIEGQCQKRRAVDNDEIQNERDTAAAYIRQKKQTLLGHLRQRESRLEAELDEKERQYDDQMNVVINQYEEKKTELEAKWQSEVLSLESRYADLVSKKEQQIQQHYNQFVIEQRVDRVQLADTLKQIKEKMLGQLKMRQDKQLHGYEVKQAAYKKALETLKLRYEEMVQDQIRQNAINREKAVAGIKLDHETMVIQYEQAQQSLDEALALKQNEFDEEIRQQANRYAAFVDEAELKMTQKRRALMFDKTRILDETELEKKQILQMLLNEKQQLNMELSTLKDRYSSMTLHLESMFKKDRHDNEKEILSLKRAFKLAQDEAQVVYMEQETMVMAEMRQLRGLHRQWIQQTQSMMKRQQKQTEMDIKEQERVYQEGVLMFRIEFDTVLRLEKQQFNQDRKARHAHFEQRLLAREQAFENMIACKKDQWYLEENRYKGLVSQWNQDVQALALQKSYYQEYEHKQAASGYLMDTFEKVQKSEEVFNYLDQLKMHLKLSYLSQVESDDTLTQLLSSLSSSLQDRDQSMGALKNRVQELDRRIRKFSGGQARPVTERVSGPYRQSQPKIIRRVK